LCVSLICGFAWNDKPVIFQKEWGIAWSRVHIEKKADEANEELKIWAVEKMEVLYRELKPLLASAEAE
jgi:hypothetical protein